MSNQEKFFRKIRESQFKIFTSPAIELNRKVYDPNFTQQEKRQLRTIFRLLLNEYLLDFFKWEPKQKVRGVINKIEHRVFIDRRLPLETYVGKHFIPLMKKSPRFSHLVEQTDLRELPEISVSDLLQLEVPIKDHPIFHGQIQEEVEETPDSNTDTDPPNPNDLRGDEDEGNDILQNRNAPANFNEQIAVFLKLTPAKKKEFLDRNLQIDEANKSTVKRLVDEKILTQNKARQLLWVSKMARLSGNNISFILALSQQKIKSLKELLGWDLQDWVTFIETNKIDIPDSEKSSATYAQNIIRNLRRTFPNQFLGQRYKQINVKGHVDNINAVAKLQKNNKKVLGRRTFDSNKLDWSGIQPAERESLEQTLASTQEFANSFPGLGIREIINDNQKPLAERKKLVRERVNAFGKFQQNNLNLDLGKVDFLKGNGLLNWDGIKEEHIPPITKQSMAIQRLEQLSEDPETTETLLKTGFDSAMSVASMPEDKFYQQSGLEYEESRLVYTKAKDISRVTSHYFEAVRDSVQGSFLKLGVNNQKNLVNDLKDIDGFDDLFGNQNYCGCEHCRSIFGAAAYFTDRMYFIQENVSEKHFDPHLPDHPLYLKNRRPDLWELKLTCENTNTELPYLQIVIEVLESFIKRSKGIEDAYEFIYEADYYTKLPVHIPLEELRIYLEYYNISLEALYKKLGAFNEKILRETLNLSKEEVHIITTDDPNQTHIKFGSTALSKLWVQPFIQMLGISRDELDELLAARFITDFEKLRIEKIDQPDDIQRFQERISGMTKPLLDILYRYYLLWRKTSWTLLEFDLVMRALKRQGIIKNLKETSEEGFPSFLWLAKAVEWKNELNLSAEQLAAVIDGLPTFSIKDNQLPYYERVFDLAALFGIASTDADGIVTYNNTFVLPANSSDDNKTPYILAGLSIAESELSQLFGLLKIDLENDITVDHSVLSNLYRNTRLAKNMGLTIEEYVGLCELLLGNNAPKELKEIDEIVQFNIWLQDSVFNVSKLLFILKGKENSNHAYGITHEDLEALVYQLHLDYNSLTEDAAANNTQSVQDYTKEALQIYLEDKFEMTTAQLNDFSEHILGNVNIVEAAKNATDVVSFDADGKVDDIAVFDKLVAIEKRLERHFLLLETLDLDVESFDFILQHQGVFGITDVQNLTHEDMGRLSQYHLLIDGLEEEDLANLQELLIGLNTSTAINTDDLAFLSKLWQYEESLLKSIVDVFSLDTIAVSKIYALKELAELGDIFGLQGQNLEKIIFDSYEEIKFARNLVSGSITAKYEEESQKEEALSTFNSKIRSIKRDALCDAIIGNKAEYKFEDRVDLYNFFLLDVEMSGCFMTSRIVCANSSLQQYVNRCLINLEQSDENLNPDIKDIRVNPNDIPEEEWSWRKNYRVWEANRKVFLYPENYIDPSLRDTKSHIFKELEDELLQQEISLESAEEAYKNYMAKFAELTKLRYAGAYYESLTNDYGFLPISLGLQSAFLNLSS